MIKVTIKSTIAGAGHLLAKGEQTTIQNEMEITDANDLHKADTIHNFFKMMGVDVDGEKSAVNWEDWQEEKNRIMAQTFKDGEVKEVPVPDLAKGGIVKDPSTVMIGVEGPPEFIIPITNGNRITPEEAAKMVLTQVEVDRVLKDHRNDLVHATEAQAASIIHEVKTQEGKSFPSLEDVGKVLAESVGVGKPALLHSERNLNTSIAEAWEAAKSKVPKPVKESEYPAVKTKMGIKHFQCAIFCKCGIGRQKRFITAGCKKVMCRKCGSWLKVRPAHPQKRQDEYGNYAIADTLV